MSFQVIVAMDRQRGIGRDGTMPWHLPSDLKYFARITKGAHTQNPQAAANTVIMGRKTWDSIPASFRPLAGRDNIVISRQADLQIQGAQLASSLHEALQIANPKSNCFVIGGATIYTLALQHPACGDLLITEIDADFDCAVFFPPLDGFERVEHGPTLADGELKISFCRWRRRVVAL